MLLEKELQKLVNQLDKINVELTYVCAISFRTEPDLAFAASEAENQNQILMRKIYNSYGIKPKSN